MIESVVEDRQSKKALFAELERIVKPRASSPPAPRPCR
ncbi:MAG: hypothetical protein R2705_06360 [Ilumatobacteraceae bacterium]